MPHRPKRPCRRPGCPGLTDDTTGYCEAHKTQYRKEQDSLRPSSNERGYDYRWHKASTRYLKERPLCVECLKDDRVVAAECVDHIKAHRGDMVLFWDEANWQPLCLHHNSVKAAREEGAFGNREKYVQT